MTLSILLPQECISLFLLDLSIICYAATVTLSPLLPASKLELVRSQALGSLARRNDNVSFLHPDSIFSPSLLLPSSHLPGPTFCLQGPTFCLQGPAFCQGPSSRRKEALPSCASWFSLCRPGRAAGGKMRELWLQ